MIIAKLQTAIFLANKKTDHSVQIRLLAWLLFMAWTSCLSLRAQTQAWVLDSPYLSGFKLVQVDQHGNRYLHGYFSRSLVIDSLLLRAEAGEYFLLKLKANGKLAWVQQSNNPLRDILWKAGRLYITGQFRGDFHLGSINLWASQGYDSFVACMDEDGNLIWLQQQSGSGDQLVAKIASSTQGYLYLAGSFTQELQLGNRSLGAILQKNIYLAAYHLDGKLNWIRQASAGNNELTGIYASALSCDARGYVYLTGNFSGEAIFSGKSLRSSKEFFSREGSFFNQDVFVARYDHQGKLTWLKNVIGQAQVRAILCDSAGSFFLTGNLAPQHAWSSPDDPDFPLASSTNPSGEPTLNVENGFLAKISPLGNLIWKSIAQGVSSSQATNIALDEKNGYVYTGGFFYQNQSATSENQRLAPSQTDIFLACHRGNGKLVWIKKGGSEGNDFVEDFHLSSAGSLHLVGRGAIPLQWDHHWLTNTYQQKSGFLLEMHTQKTSMEQN